MCQSWLMSFVEALTNVAVGYASAVLTQALVFPLFGLEVSLAQSLKIGLIFTAVSILRSYALRRVSEGLHQAWADAAK